MRSRIDPRQEEVVETEPWVTRWFRTMLRALGVGNLMEISCLYSAAAA
jgi:hypothetical protein